MFISLLHIVAATITVNGPDSLKSQFEDGNILSVYGNFGHIPYGQSIIGRLYYNPENPEGCDRNGTYTDEFHQIDQDSHQPIFMVERGDCNFVTKVRNIARAGGKLALIIDNKNENINNVILTDDGTGAGIRIPSVMIGNSDGQRLKRFFESATDEERQALKLNIQFLSAHPQKNVDVQFWYTSSDERSMRFIKDI